MSYLKPQSPLSKGSDFIYPLTTADQIIVGENGARLNTKYITVDLNEALENENAAALNADLFDGKPSSAYALQEDLIKTVNNIEPDDSGNVNLTAADVNARSNTWMPDVTELASIQRGIWDGNTFSPDLPLGITYAASDATGTTAGFPAGYTTILNIKYSNDRCFQIATQKFDGTTWIRSPLSNASEGWCPWQKLLDNTDITIKTIITDLSKTTAAPINNGAEAKAGVTGILPLTSGGTGANTKPQAVNNLNVFPIGSLYTTSTNVNPGEWLGGTWELHKKYFAQLHTFTTAETNPDLYITYDSAGVTQNHTYIRRGADSISIAIDMTLVAAEDDQTVHAGDINLTQLGVSTFGHQAYEYLAGDGANGAVLVAITKAGTINILDSLAVDGGDTIAAGNQLSGTFHWIIPDRDKLDEACDEFVWKRVS